MLVGERRIDPFSFDGVLLCCVKDHDGCGKDFRGGEETVCCGKSWV